MPNIPTNYPHSFQDCENMGERKLGNNTTLSQNDDGNWVVRLRSTDVVTFHQPRPGAPYGIAKLRTGGWNTPTTRLRFRACGFNFRRSEVEEWPNCEQWEKCGPSTHPM